MLNMAGKVARTATPALCKDIFATIRAVFMHIHAASPRCCFRNGKISSRAGFTASGLSYNM